MKRIFEMFDRSAERMEIFPSITLTVSEGVLVLRKMGFRSQHPGSLSLSSSARYKQGIFYGYLHRDGELAVRDETKKTWIERTLLQLNDDPEGFALLQSKKTSVCMFCGLPLTSVISVEFGYGPICAENWGLRWEKTKELELKILIEKYRRLKAQINFSEEAQ
jgi:hypothetical protein